MILVVVPAIDLVDRPRPLQPARRRDRGARAGPVLPLDHLPLPADPVPGFVGALWLIAHGDPLGHADLGTLDKIGLAVSIGCIGGIGINTAHELGHKRESHERWLSKIALAQSFYGHFYIEHNRGHHVRVATPEDPASAADGRELLRVLAAHGRRLAAQRVEPREAPVRPPRSSTRSGSATTCSTPG